jgi:large subunit ribosomal protein L4
MTGEQVGDVDLSADIFGVEPNIPLMHQAVVTEEANSRLGTANTKTRSDVRGGGRKPFRQKGTGRARQGSINAPQYYHGGIVFGPHPRSYEKALPKKMRRAAIKSALSARNADGDIIILDEIKLDSISTKKMAEFLKGMDAVSRTLIVLDTITEEVTKSSKNLPFVDLRLSPAVSARDLLVAHKIIMTRGAIDKLQEVLG